MYAPSDSTRILRIAAWIWIGYLLAMTLMDFVLYAPQAQHILAQNAPIQPNGPGQQPIPLINAQFSPLQGPRLAPVFLFYATNGLVAFAFLLFTHWNWIQNKLARAYYPLLLLSISAAPIIINVLIVPRFPQGPLANAEGMALRQLPVLFVALALVAWEYQLAHVIFFSVATTVLELGLILFEQNRL